MLEIPVEIDQNDFTLDVELEDEAYTLHFSWNSFGQFWTLGFLDQFGEPLVVGLPLMANSFLLEQYRIAGLPPGDFLVQYLSEGEPTRGSFLDGSAKLLYLSKEENDEIS